MTWGFGNSLSVATELTSEQIEDMLRDTSDMPCCRMLPI
jgi:hypothetical protein